jgi:hypothetical protein
MFSKPIAEVGGGIIKTIATKCFALALVYSLLLVFVLGSMYILECWVISLSRENCLI